MNQDKTLECLKKKLEILKKIGTNTEIQIRFVRRREMTGIRRLLREREKLIDELAAVHAQMSECNQKYSRYPAEIASLIHELGDMQQNVLDANTKLLREALCERSRIADDLKNIRLKRNLNNRYVGYWEMTRPGRRFNKKG